MADVQDPVLVRWVLALGALGDRPFPMGPLQAYTFEAMGIARFVSTAHWPVGETKHRPIGPNESWMRILVPISIVGLRRITRCSVMALSSLACPPVNSTPWPSG